MKYVTEYSQLVMPDHVNGIGTLFGGQLISWLDLASVKAAQSFHVDTGANGAVTKLVENIEFIKPVLQGMVDLCCGGDFSRKNFFSSNNKKFQQ